MGYICAKDGFSTRDTWSCLETSEVSPTKGSYSLVNGTAILNVYVLESKPYLKQQDLFLGKHVKDCSVNLVQLHV